MSCHCHCTSVICDPCTSHCFISLSLLFYTTLFMIYLFILALFLLLSFCSLLVVSGKLKMSPVTYSPTLTETGRSHHPPSPSFSHHSLQSCLRCHGQRTLTGKNMLELGASKVKPRHFILLFSPFVHYPTRADGQMSSVFPMTVCRLLFPLYYKAPVWKGLKC